MPTREWSLRATNTAKFGLSWTQSGATLSVTVQKWRQSTATYNNFARTLTVTVTGNASQVTASSTNQSFPTAMATNTWVNTDVLGYAFTLPTGVSTVDVTVVWSQPAVDGWINQTHVETITVTPVYNVPAAPTSVVATRSSDTLITLAWTTNATSPAPYTSQEAYRSENGSSLIDTAALSGTANSYSAVTVANKKYTFTIQARNSAGSTNSVASNIILTTPAKLASLTASKVATGIKVTFSKLDVLYTEAQVLLEITTNSGSTWSTVTTLNASAMSTTTTTDYTHTTGAPTTGTAQYRATVKTNGGTQGVLSSAVTLSNAMTLNTPPLAPTNLAPNGLVDVASPVTLSWQHNPSSDGADQSSRQIQYSTNGGTTQVDIVVGNSTAQSYAWTVSTASFTAGQTILWRVRTAGSQAGTYGAYSAWQTLTLRKSLTVAVTSPSGTWAGGNIPVVWTATASWGSASQVAYRIIMTSGSVTAFDSGTVTSSSLTGSIPASYQSNATAYTITVTVVDTYGLTSLPASTSITTSFLAPGAVGLTWAYDDNLGQMVFTPSFLPLTASALDDTASWMLERSLDNLVWSSVGTFDGNNPISDAMVRVGAASWYRTTGYTALGAAGPRTVFAIPATDVVSKWGRLGYGSGYSQMVRFGWSQTVDVTSGRASEVYDVEGVDYPVAVFGAQLTRKYVVSGKLLYTQSAGASGILATRETSTADDMVTLAETAGVCLFRDPRGAWWTARVTDMRVTPSRVPIGRPDEAVVQFTIERVTA